MQTYKNKSTEIAYQIVMEWIVTVGKGQITVRRVILFKVV